MEAFKTTIVIAGQPRSCSCELVRVEGWWFKTKIYRIVSDDGKYEYEGTLDNKNQLQEGTLYCTSNDPKGNRVWGDEYKGNFKNGQLTGQGKLLYKNGDVATGEFKNGQLTKGKLQYFSEENFSWNEYEGEFRNNMPHGQGKKTNIQGEVFEGRFEKGVLSGSGKITYSNGSLYEGWCENDKPNGKGIMRYLHHRHDKKFYQRYEGEWKNGKWHGEGSLINYNNNKQYDGYFINGKPNKTAKFKITYNNYDDIKYYEGYVNDKLEKHGNGKLYYHGGDKYIGNFENDRRFGYGQYFFENGTVKTGIWDGKKMTLANGEGHIAIRDRNSYGNDAFIKKNIRERHNELFIAMASRQYDSGNYMRLKEYENTINKKYKGDNLGVVLTHEQISGERGKRDIDKTLLQQRINEIETRIDEYIRKNKNFKVLKLCIDDEGYTRLGSRYHYKKRIMPFVKGVLNIAKKKGINNILITNASKTGAIGDDIFNGEGGEDLVDVVKEVFPKGSDVNLFLKTNQSFLSGGSSLQFYSKQYTELGEDIDFIKNSWSGGEAVVGKFDPSTATFQKSNKQAIKDMYQRVKLQNDTEKKQSQISMRENNVSKGLPPRRKAPQRVELQNDTEKKQLPISKGLPPRRKALQRVELQNDTEKKQSPILMRENDKLKDDPYDRDVSSQATTRTKTFTDDRQSEERFLRSESDQDPQRCIEYLKQNLQPNQNKNNDQMNNYNQPVKGKLVYPNSTYEGGISKAQSYGTRKLNVLAGNEREGACLNAKSVGYDKYIFPTKPINYNAPIYPPMSSVVPMPFMNPMSGNLFNTSVLNNMTQMILHAQFLRQTFMKNPVGMNNRMSQNQATMPTYRQMNNYNNIPRNAYSSQTPNPMQLNYYNNNQMYQNQRTFTPMSYSAQFAPVNQISNSNLYNKQMPNQVLNSHNRYNLQYQSKIGKQVVVDLTEGMKKRKLSNEYIQRKQGQCYIT